MIHTGDAIEVMAAMEPDSVDAVVTDPPYGLEFMGKDWDSFKTYAGGNPNMKPQGANVGESSGASYGWRQKNPRCRKCGKLARGNGSCKCPVPDLDMRGAESGYQFQYWCEAWGREALRVTKPGGYLLAFGGTRTHHRLVCGLEDAGWEIRDELEWVFASGFPKSLDVSKALDKAAGALSAEGVGFTVAGYSHNPKLLTTAPSKGYVPPIPATDLAKQWDGWGTALKPAHEPIVLARKPLVGSVAANVTRYGTGALNIGATRIPGSEIGKPREAKRRDDRENWRIEGGSNGSGATDPAGRWPSNLLLSDPELFDQPNPYVVGSGAVTGGGDKQVGGPPRTEFFGLAEGSRDRSEALMNYGDSGGYSRFFIVPKSARVDREPVLRGQLDKQEGGAYAGGAGLSGRTMIEGQWVQTPIEQRKARENAHPTVKPTDLMRHLVRLVTPQGGTVLDCFLGSGSTAIAAELEGFAWVGIEKEPEYVAIAEARLNGTQRGLGLDVPAPTHQPKTIGQQGPWTEAYSGYSQGWGKQRREPEGGSDKPPAETISSGGAGEDPAGFFPEEVA